MNFAALPDDAYRVSDHGRRSDEIEGDAVQVTRAVAVERVNACLDGKLETAWGQDVTYWRDVLSNGGDEEETIERNANAILAEADPTELEWMR